ncbi:plasmid pRiA4b ORF-3 family protein [Flavobacteriales bacterium]|nr:plasmid pRiA4b ORF-3 family protein [Flavobacteriales bacterium]
MIKIIRIHLEHKDDVIRDIAICSEKTIEDLHFEIIDALELDKNEMASFYMTNDEFELLQEIPLFKIDDKENSMLGMNEITVGAVFPEVNSQLLYVYDFLKMWRFSITFIEESDNETTENSCIKSIGEMPKEAPEIQFEAKKEFDPFETAFEDFDEFNEYEY